MIQKSSFDLFSNALFGCICHQDPSSLIQINGESLMLCPRCMGLQAGFFVVLILMLLAGHRDNPLKGFYAKLFCFLALGFLGAAWLLAQFAYIESSIESRYFSGWFAGNAFALLAFAYRGRFKSQQRPAKPKNLFSVSLILIVALFAGVLYIRINKLTFFTPTLLVAVIVNFVFVLQVAYLRIKHIDFNLKVKQT